MNGKEKLPNWERLWFDLAHEEIRRNTRDGVTSKEEEEEFSIVGKGMKAKGNKAQGEANSNQKNDKKMDLSKIKRF